MNINLENKFEKFSEYWHPYIIGELNDNHVKIAKLKGELVWHSHEYEDELFIVLRGTLMMDFRDANGGTGLPTGPAGKTVVTKQGEILIVPKKVEHRPWTNGEEVRIMLIEPKSIKHTGDIKVEQTVEKLEWI